jgi:hypothetical protein
MKKKNFFLSFFHLTFEKLLFEKESSQRWAPVGEKIPHRNGSGALKKPTGAH